MKPFNDFLQTISKDQSLAYTLIRSFLGIVLFVRGVILFQNPDAILELVKDNQYHMWFSYVTIGHLLGGLFLALGIFSRLGALLQIPILAGAVFLVSQKALMRGDQSFELASLVLFLLVVCFIFGSGTKSLGAKLRVPNL